MSFPLCTCPSRGRLTVCVTWLIPKIWHDVLVCVLEASPHFTPCPELRPRVWLICFVIPVVRLVWRTSYAYGCGIPLRCHQDRRGLSSSTLIFHKNFEEPTRFAIWISWLCPAVCFVLVVSWSDRWAHWDWAVTYWTLVTNVHTIFHLLLTYLIISFFTIQTKHILFR